MKDNGKMRGEISREILAVIEQISPLLANKHPFVPGAALADLTAQWICNHVMPDDPEGQRQLREEVLLAHVRAIRDLIEFYSDQSE